MKIAENRLERSGARSGKSRGAVSGGYRNRLERGAVFFAAHAPLTCSDDKLKNKAGIPVREFPGIADPQNSRLEFPVSGLIFSARPHC